MSSIDERVVSMKFNNNQFLKGVSDTNKSLDDLKKGLNLDGAKKSLEGLDQAGKNFSLAGIANGVDNIASKFSALSIIGITALASIATKAVDAGLALVHSLTVEPIKAGLEEYETNLNAIQTILSNTQSAGTTLDDVNGALQELNTYSDQTIYNFSQMAKNIGTFTAAGVDLKTSTAAIKGIANLAAVSGSNADQASTAMYQLSQALSTGKVSLMDWNSVVNAGMGGKVFQDAILETARNQGVAVDSLIKKNGSFRDSLQEGWLTSKILTETLSKFTGDMTADQLKSMGYNEEQIAGIIKMGETAKDAATKVKTMSQLIGTLQEAAGSGWAQTWQLVFGDFEEAKTLFTNVNNVLGGMIGQSASARNKMIGDWKALGGRTVLIDAISMAFNNVIETLRPIKEAFREIFPPTTGQQLYDITKAIHVFIENLTPSKKTLDEINRTFRGLFAALDIGRMIVKGLFDVFKKVFGEATKGSGGILEFTAKIGDWLVKVRNAIKTGEGLGQFFENLGNILVVPIRLLRFFGGVLASAIDILKNVNTDGFTKAIGRMQVRLDPLAHLGENLDKIWKGFLKTIENVKKFFAPMAEAFAKQFGQLGQAMTEGMKTADFSGVLDILNTGLLGGIALLIRKFLKKGVNVDLSGGIVDKIKEAFGGLTDTLGAMQTNLKAGTLMKIAGAIALLTVSVVALSMIDSGRLASAIAGIGAMMLELMGAMVIMDKMTGMTGFTKLPVLAVTMMLLAIAVDLLAIAVGKLAKLDWQGLLKGLTGVIVLLGGLVGVAKGMSGVQGNLVGAGIGMIAVAVAVKILASAVGDFAKMDWQKMMQGLIGVGIVLGGLTLFTRLAEFNKGAVGSSVGLILLGVALKVMASAVKDFAEMDNKQLEKGLGSLIGVLGALAIFTRISDPQGIMRTGIAMVILGAALKIIVTAVQDFAGLSWDQIGRGLTAMAGALAAITIAMNLMPANMIVTATALVIVGAALKIIASALKDMGGMSWEEIGKSMVVLAGSLLILAGAMYLMTGALPGAAAILVVSAALAILTPCLVALGKMSWDEIGRGLTVLAGALAIIGLFGLLIAPIVPALIGLGTAILLIGAGTALVGLGLMAFAVGLTLVAAAGAGATVVLVGMVTALLGLIPLAMQKIGEGIIEFAKVISDGGPAITEALTVVLISLITAIATVSPLIVQTLWDLLMLLTQTLLDNVPKMVDSGMKLLKGILDGIGANIGDIVNSAVTIVVNFVNALGSPENVKKVVDAGANFVVNLVNGVANGIRDHSQEMRDAGGNLGMAIADGMTGGLASKAKSAADEAWNLGKIAIDALKRATDSHSPSRKAHEIGGWTGEGFALGISDQTKMVANSAASMGESALSSLKDSMSGMSMAMMSDMDMQPTIRPVLDLSAVKKDSSLINGMITPPSLSVSGTYAKATVLSTAAQENQKITPNKGTDVPPAGTKIEFTQINQSPKALSEIDIYRRTNNQLSKLKEVVDK